MRPYERTNHKVWRKKLQNSGANRRCGKCHGTYKIILWVTQYEVKGHNNQPVYKRMDVWVLKKNDEKLATVHEKVYAVQFIDKKNCKEKKIGFRSLNKIRAANLILVMSGKSCSCCMRFQATITAPATWDQPIYWSSSLFSFAQSKPTFRTCKMTYMGNFILQVWRLR